MWKKKKNWIGFFSFILLSWLIPIFYGETAQKMDLIGQEIPNFTLPSTFDRAIHYSEEYYGKHFLIITFFPAAFTPI